MRARRVCETVLFINEDRAFIDAAGDALRAQGLAVLLVPGYDEALGALRSGFRPDAVLIDLTTGSARFGPFLRVLFENLAWRSVPVLGVSGDDSAVFQIAPRERVRKLPAPSDAEQMTALLEAVCAEAQASDLHAS